MLSQLKSLLALAIVVATAVFVYVNVYQKNEIDSNKPAVEVQKTDDQVKDEIKNERAYGIQGILLAYSINNKQYPPSTKAGWDKLLSQSKDSDSLVDPFTKSEYKFTSSAPEYGEIQYKFPASCDDDRKEFVSANSKQSFAFRLKYSDGIRCSHSL